MKTEYGILVDHDFGVQIHRKDCKDFLNPKNHTRTIGDFPVLEQIRIPLELDQETDFNNSEDLKKLVVLLSDSFWGGESILYDPTIYKCTELVNRKSNTELNYGFVGGRYDSLIDQDNEIFNSLVDQAKEDWYETRYSEVLEGNYTGWKAEYYEGLSRYG